MSEGDVSLDGTISTLGTQTYKASASLQGTTTLQAGSSGSDLAGEDLIFLIEMVNIN